MKITKKIVSTLFVTLSIAVSGCSTMQDVVKVKQSGAEGTTRNYAVSEAQAWEIANGDQHYMLTSSGVNLVSWGAVMGAWVEPVKDDETKVTVVTKRRVTMNVATTLTETTFHKRFAQAVNIVRKGQPLPAEAP